MGWRLRFAPPSWDGLDRRHCRLPTVCESQRLSEPCTEFCKDVLIFADHPTPPQPHQNSLTNLQSNWGGGQWRRGNKRDSDLVVRSAAKNLVQSGEPKYIYRDPSAPRKNFHRPLWPIGDCSDKA